MRNILIGIFLLIFSYTSAQNCDLTLYGNILDFHNNQPLQNAEIRVLGVNITAISESDGSFAIKGLCPDQYDIEVYHELCEPLYETVILNSTDTIDLFMEHHTILLSDIETKGRQKRAIQTQAEQHLHEAEIEKYSASSLGDILKTQTGISGLETGSSIVKPIIHGMHSSRIITMNRGVRQEDMEWGIEHAPNMDLNSFDDIRIIKGAGALRCGGDGIGGVIITETAHLPKNDTLYGKAVTTLLSNGRGANLNAQIIKGFSIPLSLQVQGSYKKLGDSKAPNYYLRNSGNTQKAISTIVKYGDYKQNVTFDYSYFDTSIGILKASHIGNLNDLAEAINNENPTVDEGFSYNIDKPYQRVLHHLAKLKGEKRFRNLGKVELQYDFQLNQRKEFDVRNGEVSDIPSMNVELATHSVNSHFTLDKYDGFTLETGINLFYQNNQTDPVTQVKRLIPDYTKQDAGVYINGSYSPSNIWKATIGGRFDYKSIHTKKYYYKRYWEEMAYDALYSDNIIGDFGNQWLTEFDLRFNTFSLASGINYSPSNVTEISLNYAYAKRAPNPSELFSEGLHHSAVSIELGDVSMQPEKSNKIALNLNHTFDLLNGMNLNVTGYYNSIKDYINQIPTGADYTIRGAFPVWRFIQTDAIIKGMDIDVTTDITSELNYAAQLAVVYGNDASEDIPLIMMPPFNWRQNLTYQWNSISKPYLSVNTHYVAKQYKFPMYNFTLSTLDNGTVVEKEVDISSTPDAYFLTGLEAGLTVKLNQNPLTIQTKIDNIFNIAYRNYLNRLRYFTDERGRQIQIQLIYKF